jgi:endo-1,4-beta-xylanase
MSHYRGQIGVWDVVNEAVSNNSNSLRDGIKNPSSPEKLAANIKRLNELGLEGQITEMDGKIFDGNGTLTQRLAAQSDVYRNMMQICLAAQNCQGFSLWGVNDRYS